RILLKYKQCDNTFIAVSKYIEQFLRKNIPNKLQKIIMLYNAINTADFIVANKHDIRFSNNSRDKLNIVSVGTLIPRKNQKLQIEIIQELKKRGINVELNILGEGAEKQKLMEYTRLLGLDKEIRFLGNVDNVAEYFSNSDIMLHTSIDESFGLVLVEAMAAGLPCVALDGMGNREVISNGEEGYIIDKQDVYQFADKIQYIISDDNIWRSFSNKAASKAQQYDINNYIDDLSDIYKKSLVKGL
ncbi:MAG TPA: glycosyltransferase family 4 protein, partial [Bacteroidales bacterium]|nr:glycosyltransferase family 4 protein [Bacteroidales bacterium]